MPEFFKEPKIINYNKTKKWCSPDTKEQYYKIKNKIKTCYGPDDIEYKFNNYGFRCDNFTSWSDHKNRILFAGCSMTEGIGLSLNDTWAKLMHEKICKDFKITMPFWSIASGGTGLDQMVRYLYLYGDILRPQIIISNLPGIARRELWDSKLSEYEERNHNILFEEKLITYQTEKNLAMMHLLLEKWDTEFLFISNDRDFDISYMKLNRFKQFKTFNIEQEDWDFARDGLHAGPKTNKVFFKKFYKLIKPSIKKKLNVNRV